MLVAGYIQDHQDPCAGFFGIALSVSPFLTPRSFTVRSGCRACPLRASWTALWSIGWAVAAFFVTRARSWLGSTVAFLGRFEPDGADDVRFRRLQPPPRGTTSRLLGLALRVFRLEGAQVALCTGRQ